MRYRSFGKTGWQVSEIGFGAWQLGGDWGDTDDAASIRTLHHAFERGINFVDTAQMYGPRPVREHRRCGAEAMARRPHLCCVQSATHRLAGPDEDKPAMRGRYPRWHLRAEVEACLRRLQLERLDLPAAPLLDACRDIRARLARDAERAAVRGKDRPYRRVDRDYRPDDGIDLARLGLVESMQVVFNLFEQRPASGLFKAAENDRPAFIARVPLDSGSLSGNWTRDTYTSWQTGSVPHTLFRGARFAETLARVEALKTLCAPYFPTLAEAAMRYALSAPETTTVIPGMRSPAEIDMNIACSDGTAFPPELLAQLPAHAWPRNYYQ